MHTIDLPPTLEERREAAAHLAWAGDLIFGLWLDQVRGELAAFRDSAIASLGTDRLNFNYYFQAAFMPLAGRACLHCRNQEERSALYAVVRPMLDEIKVAVAAHQAKGATT